MFELYMEKRDPSSPYLWQRPKSTPINYIDSTWYEKRRVGHNQLETFMKELCVAANLSRKDYKNHSIRATCITNLDKAGFEGRHIIAVSGHKSEQTVRDYADTCPTIRKEANV